jgi:hypothetical protein
MTQPVSEWHVPAGKYSRPIPKFLYRLSAPLRSPKMAIVRIAVGEFCNLRQRILATHRIGYQTNGLPIPCDPRPGPPSIAFEFACNDGIQRLFREPGVRGVLDIQVYMRGFQEGATFVANTPRNPVEHEEFPEAESSGPVYQAARRSRTSQTRSAIPAAIAGVTRSDL